MPLWDTGSWRMVMGLARVDHGTYLTLARPGARKRLDWDRL